MSLDLGASAGRVRALRWHSAAQIKTLEGRLHASLQAWCEAWGLGPLALRCEPAWMAPAGDAVRWHALAESAEGEGIAWLGSAVTSPHEHLATRLFGSPPPRPGGDEALGASLAQALGQDAWQALRHALTAGLHGAVPVDTSLDTVPPASDSRTWSGAVRATLSLGSSGATGWLLHARAPAVDGGSPLPATRAAASPRAALQTLPLALARHRVGLQARLADVPVTLGELLALQPGDVLLTAHRLAEPLGLFSPPTSTQPLHAAYLAQRAGQMAAVLAPTPNDRLEGIRMNSNTPAPHDAPTAQWLGLPEATDPPAGAPALPASASPLLGVKTTLQVCVGEAALTVGELTQARVGQVIKLDRAVDGLVDLLLDGRVVARGQLVAVDDCFGVRLTELPLPLNANGTASGA